MRRIKPLPNLSRTLAFAAPAVALTATRVDAADIFMKIAAIDGESTAKTHPQWIEISSMGFGVSVTGNAITGPGKPQAKNLVLTKSLDTSSPPLFFKCAKGETIPEVRLEIGNPNSNGAIIPFYKITLSGVVVTSLESSTSESNLRPQESVSFSYQKISMEYTKLVDGKASTPVVVGWDFLLNK